MYRLTSSTVISTHSSSSAGQRNRSVSNFCVSSPTHGVQIRCPHGVCLGCLSTWWHEQQRYVGSTSSASSGSGGAPPSSSASDGNIPETKARLVGPDNEAPALAELILHTHTHRCHIINIVIITTSSSLVNIFYTLYSAAIHYQGHSN